MHINAPPADQTRSIPNRGWIVARGYIASFAGSRDPIGSGRVSFLRAVAFGRRDTGLLAYFANRNLEPGHLISSRARNVHSAGARNSLNGKPGQKV